jgi:hypothetical protein
MERGWSGVVQGRERERERVKTRRRRVEEGR